MTAKEFFGQCSVHDWFYDYSDDQRVYSQGQRATAILISVSKTDPLFERIYKAWSDYVWSGPPFKTERKPQPKLSDFGL